jgi:hypothetical protein
MFLAYSDLFNSGHVRFDWFDTKYKSSYIYGSWNIINIAENLVLLFSLILLIDHPKQYNINFEMMITFIGKALLDWMLILLSDSRIDIDDYCLWFI